MDEKIEISHIFSPSVYILILSKAIKYQGEIEKRKGREQKRMESW